MEILFLHGISLTDQANEANKTYTNWIGDLNNNLRIFFENNTNLKGEIKGIEAKVVCFIISIFIIIIQFYISLLFHSSSSLSASR